MSRQTKSASEELFYSRQDEFNRSFVRALFQFTILLLWPVYPFVGPSNCPFVRTNLCFSARSFVGPSVRYFRTLACRFAVRRFVRPSTSPYTLIRSFVFPLVSQPVPSLIHLILCRSTCSFLLRSSETWLPRSFVRSFVRKPVRKSVRKSVRPSVHPFFYPCALTFS